MHRDERIGKALATLRLIEQAVARDTQQIAGIPADIAVSYLQHRVDNAVRIYCADDMAEAIVDTGPS